MKVAIHSALMFLKNITFRYYWLIPTTMAASYAIKILSDSSDFHQNATPIIGGSFALLFFIQKQKLDESTFFQKQFESFNKRYDELNDNLECIIKSQSVSLESYPHLIDYFNLCSEEYLLYTKGYIPLEVWNSWVAGMGQYWSIPDVMKIWRLEKETSSYYGFDPESQIPNLNKLHNDVNIRSAS